MSLLTTNSFSPVVRSTHEEFVACRPEGLRKVSYRRLVPQHIIAAVGVPERIGAAA